MSFSQSVSIRLSTRFSLIISFCVVMAFCSFSSLVGEMCGPSPENPNVVRLLDLKNCARDVKAHKLPDIFATDFTILLVFRTLKIC